MASFNVLVLFSAATKVPRLTLLSAAACSMVKPCCVRAALMNKPNDVEVQASLGFGGWVGLTFFINSIVVEFYCLINAREFHRVPGLAVEEWATE